MQEPPEDITPGMVIIGLSIWVGVWAAALLL